MDTWSVVRVSRVVALGAGVVLAALVVPAVSGAQQQLDPVEVGPSADELRANQLEEYARSLYATPRRFSEAARLHHRAALIRGDDPKAAASFRSAAWAYSASHNNGLATQMMVKAGEKAAMTGRIEEAAHAYIDAAFLAVASHREDKVPALLSRMYVVLGAPLVPDDTRTAILKRVRDDTRIAHLDPGGVIAGK